MDNHSLIEVAHMLHRVRLTIVDGEHWLMEPSRKYFLGLCKAGSCVDVCDGVLHRRKKTRRVEFLTFTYN